MAKTTKFKLAPVQLFQSQSARKMLVDLRESFGTIKRKSDNAIALLHLDSAIHNIDEFMTIAGKRQLKDQKEHINDELLL